MTPASSTTQVAPNSQLRAVMSLACCSCRLPRRYGKVSTPHSSTVCYGLPNTFSKGFRGETAQSEVDGSGTVSGALCLAKRHPRRITAVSQPEKLITTRTSASPPRSSVLRSCPGWLSLALSWFSSSRETTAWVLALALCCSAAVMSREAASKSSCGH